MDKSVEKREKADRNDNGQYLPGHSLAGPGRNEQTEADIIKTKAINLLAKEYRATLANSFPDVAPALIKKALEGDVPAIRELKETVIGKAPQRQDITSGGEPLPILGNITINIEEDYD